MARGSSQSTTGSGKGAGKGRGKGKAKAELAAQADPKAPLDVGAFLAAAWPVHKRLAEDLVARADASPGLTQALEASWEREQAARRTADSYEVWRRAFAAQVASAWVLSVVFVRTLEDRGLLERNRIAGQGAADSQKLFYELAPYLTPRDYLLAVFRELSHLPAVRELFDAEHNLVWRLAPSAEVAEALLALFRQPSTEEPAFRFGQADSRFLGDLYQNLDEDVRKRYALLQTPDFVESFILDQTLEPAIKEYGLENTTLIDPTCGSGHFLLGAFARLFRQRLEKEPGRDRRQAAVAALGAVYGVDINPYAVAIARFRLTLAFIGAAGFDKLAAAPAVHTNLVVADSLLHGREDVDGQRQFAGLATAQAQQWRGDLFALEDEAAAKAVLELRYAAVVGNPPYITEKDSQKRELYREMYESASGLFALGAPFTERFFGLARQGGFVGLINANSFMKREFGKSLIERFLPTVDLTKVIDTSGAYIPGHGTPTVLLFGRMQKPSRGAVPTVMGKRGEPSTPEDASQGLVWSSARDHHRSIGFENEYISVAEMPRDTFSRHPWSLGGGGVAELKELLEHRTSTTLRDLASEIGFICITRADEVYFAPPGALRRKRLQPVHIVVNVEGEKVRDWAISDANETVFPYAADLEPVADTDGKPVHRFLWPYREILWRRREPNGDHRQLGRTWWEWSRFQKERFDTPFSIAFAFVATHNHFVLDRGGKVFNRTAPVIKLPEGANEEDHLALVAYLNSSTACFWMKQVLHDKGSGSDKGKWQSERAKIAFEFAATPIQALPVPEFSPAQRERLISLSRELLAHCERRARLPSELVLASSTGEERARFEAAQAEDHALLEQSIAAQEDLDWLVYVAFGLHSDAAVVEPTPSGARLPLGARPFEVRDARKGQAFGIDGQALTEAPPPVPSSCAVEARIRACASGDLAKIETPDYKRRWLNTPKELAGRVETFEGRTAQAVRLQAMNVVEETLRGRKQGSPVKLSDVRAALEGSAAFQSLLRLAECAQVGMSEELQVAALMNAAAVPFLAALRFTASGMEKRLEWERCWELQRAEDRGERVPTIQPPPKYRPEDYLNEGFEELRGKLDVPHERFISYPGCESDEDHQPVYGWAGWNHLEQAQALAALYQQRKTEEGWGKERLIPMLAGLRELIPWVKQWHNEPNPDYDGMRLGDYFEDFLRGQCHELGIKDEDLVNWRPTPAPRGKKAAAAKKPAKAKVPEEVEPE